MSIAVEYLERYALIMRNIATVLILLFILVLVACTITCSSGEEPAATTHTSMPTAAPTAIPTPTLSSFTSSDRLVCTYYFYWYDIHSGYHMDQLTNRPPDEYLSNFSWKEIAWHKRELIDMVAVGIDIVLPVYWGNADEKFWSIEGLKQLVNAEQELVSEGYNPPKIGMFFDTSVLPPQINLTMDDGKAIFYQMIKDLGKVLF